MTKSIEKMTSIEIRDWANKLALDFYRAHGYTVPDGYRFDQATHPQERGMWNLAAIAFEELTYTNLDDVLSDIEEDES